VHYEAYPSVHELNYILPKIKALGFKVGVAISPETPVEVLKDVVADQYLIMSVVPGKQGQAFISTSPNKIKELRSLLPHAIIEVDGGVNETNIKILKEAGADLICVGSSLVKAQDVNLEYAKLLAAIT
jgi:ribulose-phosphate 3-epimerase